MFRCDFKLQTMTLAKFPLGHDVYLIFQESKNDLTVVTACYNVTPLTFIYLKKGAENYQESSGKKGGRLNLGVVNLT